MNQRYKNGIIALTVIVLLVGSYFFLTGSSTQPTDAPTAGSPLQMATSSARAAGASEAMMQNRQTITLLNELRGISLSTDLFNSRAFNSLRNFGVTLNPQPVGRGNPFAPIGVEFDPVASQLFLEESAGTNTATTSSATTTTDTATTSEASDTGS